MQKVRMFRTLQNPPNRIFESSKHSLSVRLLTKEYNCRKYEQIRTWQRLLSIRSLLAVTEHPMGTTPEELMATQNVEKVPKGSTLEFLLSTTSTTKPFEKATRKWLDDWLDTVRRSISIESPIGHCEFSIDQLGRR